MTEVEMLKQENKLLKEQIELYKKLLEEKDKKKEKEYIPYPYYPNPYQFPSVTWSDHTDLLSDWVIKY
jgi:hypothetical protein